MQGKTTHFSKTMQQARRSTKPSYAMMHAHSIVPHQQMPITRHTKTIGGTIRTLPIYTSRFYVQSLHNVVSVLADKHKI